MNGQFCTAIYSFLMFAAPFTVLAMEASNTLPIRSFPQNLIVIDSTNRSAIAQYNIYQNVAISPYIGIGEREQDSDPQAEFWQDRSYQSEMQPSKTQQRWAGLKIRMHEMLRLTIDTDTRKMSSTLSLAPKTDLKLRGNLKEIRAELRYRF